MIDSHCHLADAAFAADLTAVVARAQAAGVRGALCILSADEPEEIARAGAVREAWPAAQFAAAIHPHRAGAYAGRASEAAAIVATALDAVGAIAVGEIGLDYHYDLAPADAQREVFAAQLDLAVARGRPVVIHTREATGDTLALMRAAGPSLRAVLHCFTGPLDEARVALDAGYWLSISGIATFPRAANLREVAAFVPADRLLVETDAPYLAPVPHRGARNEPAWVADTLAVVAAARGVTVRELGETVSANFARLFGPEERAHAR